MKANKPLNCLYRNGMAYHDFLTGRAAVVLLWFGCRVNLKVSHSTARALSRAQLRVHLDDELIGKEMLPYPALKDPLTLCHIGTNEQAQTVFCGQMAHFSLQEELDSVRLFSVDQN